MSSFEYDEWEGDSFEEPEWDADDDDVSLTRPCPQCGAEVYEDAEQCPQCGEYITFSSNVWDGKPVWWVVLGLLGIIAVTWVFLL